MSVESGLNIRSVIFCFCLYREKNLRNSLDGKFLEGRNHVAFIFMWILKCSKCSIKLYGMSDVGYRIRVKAFWEMLSLFKKI